MRLYDLCMRQEGGYLDDTGNTLYVDQRGM